MAQSDTIVSLDALISTARKRLEANPDYRTLRALEKAREEILGLTRETQRVINDSTGEELLVTYDRTGIFRERRLSHGGAAEIALREAGHPLQIDSLLEKVIAKGAVVGGKNPRINLSSTLSRLDGFKSVQWEGGPAWWLAKEPIPKHSNGSLLRE